MSSLSSDDLASSNVQDAAVNSNHSAPTTVPFPLELVASSGQESLLLKVFLSNVLDYVYFKDIHSRFIAVSASLARRHGIEPADMIGKTDADFFTREHAQPAFDDEQSIIRTGKSIVNKLEKETVSDRVVTWAVTTKLPLRDDTGVIVGTFGMSKDVTDSVKVEKALEAAQQQLMDATRQAGMAEVATGVLHNVGNVLTSINVTANLLTDRFRDSTATHARPNSPLIWKRSRTLSRRSGPRR